MGKIFTTLTATVTVFHDNKNIYWKTVTVAVNVVIIFAADGAIQFAIQS